MKIYILLLPLMIILGWILRGLVQAFNNKHLNSYKEEK